VYKQAFVALTFGLVFALCSASCGPTCPAGQQSCGSANAGPSDAGATDSGSVSCSLLTAFKSCMTAYCATASNPFCTCYKRGFDISTNGCKCIDFDAKRFCDDANGADGTNYDCAAASSSVSSFCVPVR
jgi:hypothetical protein